MGVISCDANVQKLQKMLKIPETACSWELHVDYNTGKAIVYYKELKSEWVNASGVYRAVDSDINLLAEYLGVSGRSREWKLSVEPEEVVVIADVFFPTFDKELPDLFKDSQ